MSSLSGHIKYVLFFKLSFNFIQAKLEFSIEGVFDVDIYDIPELNELSRVIKNLDNGITWLKTNYR